MGDSPARIVSLCNRCADSSDEAIHPPQTPFFWLCKQDHSWLTSNHVSVLWCDLVTHCSGLDTYLRVTAGCRLKQQTTGRTDNTGSRQQVRSTIDQSLSETGAHWLVSPSSHLVANARRAEVMLMAWLNGLWADGGSEHPECLEPTRVDLTMAGAGCVLPCPRYQRLSLRTKWR